MSRVRGVPLTLRSSQSEAGGYPTPSLRDCGPAPPRETGEADRLFSTLKSHTYSATFPRIVNS